MKDGYNYDKDDFWDIEKLIVKNEKQVVKHQRSDTEAIEIVLGEPIKNNGNNNLSYNKTSYSEKTEPRAVSDEYKPDSPLISNVRIYEWKYNYNYYESFIQDAKKYKNAVAAECQYIPFFSYVPQYCQLSHDRLCWYLYWRDRVRHDEFIMTDYSYIMLFVYEIINLSDDMDTHEGQKLLCKIHQNYRSKYPQLDRYLGEWICDYSLIHHLPPPSDFDEELIDNSTLREFYVSSEKDSNDADKYAEILMKYCSGYDYRKSKFNKDGNKALFDKHISAALSCAVKECSENGRILSGAGLECNTLTRDAYNGALCASEIKRRFEIEYFSFSRSHELRFLVADIIKYSENKLRAYLGIKSRLSVYGLPKNITASLDGYFSKNNLSVAKKMKQSENTDNEYEKFYDTPHSELSLKNASKIEERSWNTTNALVEAFDEEETESNNMPITNDMPDEDIVEGFGTDALKKILKEKYGFIVAAYNEDFSVQRKLASELSVMVDALADEINDVCVDVLGDVLLEENNGGYSIIEDYRELFENDRQ